MILILNIGVEMLFLYFFEFEFLPGAPQDTEELSRQSAALVACQKLREAGELDDFLFHTGKGLFELTFEWTATLMSKHFARS